METSMYNDDFLYPARKMLNHLGGDMVEYTEVMKKTAGRRTFC